MASKKAQAVATVLSESVFVNAFLAKVEGGDALTDAQDLQEQAASILETQIAIKKGTKATKKRAVTNAQKAFELALINGGQAIEGNNAEERYLAGIINAQTAIATAEADLTKTDEDIAVLEALLEKVNA